MADRLGSSAQSAPEYVPGVTSATATAVLRSPIDAEVSEREIALLRRLRQARREAMTSTRPCLVSIHIDDRGEMQWFVGKREK